MAFNASVLPLQSNQIIFLQTPCETPHREFSVAWEQ